MNAQEVLTQIQQSNLSTVSQELAEQSFVQVAVIEQVLGLKSERSLSLSERVTNAQSVIAELERLHAQPLKEGATLSELKTYHAQQVEVLGKLEGLQSAVSNSVLGTALTLQQMKRFKEQAVTLCDELIKDVEGRIDSIPLNQIVAHNPELASKIEVFEIPHQGTPAVLLRLKSHPSIGFPIWPKSEDRGGTQGRIFLKILEDIGVDNNQKLQVGDSKSTVNLVKEFRSICACCTSKITGNSPYEPNKPTNGEQYSKWIKTDEGVAHTKWNEDARFDFIRALKEVCRAHEIDTVAARKSHYWVDDYPDALRGIKFLEITQTDVLYEKYLGNPKVRRISEGAFFRIES
jgi:hypothetical protein